MWRHVTSASAPKRSGIHPLENYLCSLLVNTQAQTHAQIHIHAQIPAYVQLPALFQPCVLSQPSAHLHHNQAPCPATISIDLPVSAEALIITRRLCIISIDGNEVAMFYLSALRTPATGSQPSRKVNSPSSVSTYFLPLPIIRPCFNTPDPRHPHVSNPRSHDLSSLDYYSTMIFLV